MNRRLPLFLGYLLISSCRVTHTEKSSESPFDVPKSPPEEVKIAQATIQKELPFPVEIDPSGALWEADRELIRLKERFLVPLAESKHADRIHKITIDASALEWAQWTCHIYFNEGTPSIALTDYGSFYAGKDNQDPDGYKNSRAKILNLLKH